MMARLAGQRGSAVIASMAVLMLTLALGAVAGSRATVVTQGAQKNTQSKRALQAADAGVRAAVDRLNRLDVGRSTLPCAVDVDASAGGVVLDLADFDATFSASVGENWCPEVFEQLADGTSYRYRVAQAVQVTGSQVTTERTVVAVGRSAGRERRVAAQATALSGTPLFGPNAVISLQNLTLTNQARVGGNARSNGDVRLENSSEVCGDATPGPGRLVYGTLSCGGSAQPASSDLVLPPIDIGTLRTDNDNDRICQSTMPDGTQGDICTRPNQIDWDGTNGTNLAPGPNPAGTALILKNTSTITMGGSRYLLCRLELHNSSTLIIPTKGVDPATGKPTAVQIYIDAPENCGGPGTTGFLRANSAAIVNQNGDPVTLQIYALGGSPVTLENRTVANMVVYAPESTITLGNRARIVGAVAGRQVTMDNNVDITYHSSVANLTTTALFPLYRRERYRECPPSTTATSFVAGCGT